MDSRDFVKLSVAALGLRITPAASGPRAGGAAGAKRRSRSSSAVGGSSNFFCEIRFAGFQAQSAPVPLVFAEPDSRSLAANFYLEANAFDKLFSPSPATCLQLLGPGSAPCLELLLYTTAGAGAAAAAGVSSRFQKTVLGVFRIPVIPNWTDGMLLHSGWVVVNETSSGRLELHSTARIESDPRYEFQFDGDVALSPQIVQVYGRGTGKKQQPVFSCKFSKSRTRMVQGDLTPSRTPREEGGNRERKGWLVTIHDLSGSPIAAASMVTPFVAFTGSDEVSRCNPGGWLILVPEASSMGEPQGYCSWRAWGRLEAWRQEGGRMGLKFQLISPTGSMLVSETSMATNRGGEFSIDTGPKMNLHSPLPSPHSSGDCSFYLGMPTTDSGFVMSCEMRRASGGSGAVARVRGYRRNSSSSTSSSSSSSSSACSKATVQLSTKYIACVEDAAVFMALAAAVDLSRDACQPFSRKLRKELCRELF